MYAAIAVELIRHGAAESVDGGLTVNASNLAGARFGFAPYTTAALALCDSA
jgi:hypothetical protein